jgi:hypothetical protein
MSLLLILGIAFLVVWGFGLIVRMTAGGLIHVALVIALILIAFWFLRNIARVF